MRQKNSLFRLKSLNIKLAVAVLLISVTLLFFVFAEQASAFRILGPYPGADGEYIRALNPNAFPPFVHWDLREFSNCEVPWSITNNHPDLDTDGLTGPDDPVERLAVFNAVWNAFQAWEDVQPAVIGFVLGDRWDAVPAGVQGIQLDNYNLIDWVSAVAGDDIQVVPVNGAVAPGGICVTAGPNGFLETQPRDDDWIDFAVVPNVIRSVNGICETTANNLGPLDNYSGLTGLFFDNGTGVIREADIVLNNNPAVYLWGTGGMDWTVPLPVPTDIQGVATHEIGHFVGVAHPGDGPERGGGAALFPNVADAPTMSYDDRIWGAVPPVPSFELRTLAQDDERAVNFLYTPDLGDAPDPFVAFNFYPSLVHDDPSGRILNGVPLLSPALGAEHIFGTKPRGGPADNFLYEWLGYNVNGECESWQINLDAFDDGVTFAFPMPGWLRITVQVNTAADAQVPARTHNYDGDDGQAVPVGGTVAPGGIVVTPGPNGVLETNPQGDDTTNAAGNIVDGGNGIAETTENNRQLYLNIWVDWDCDGDWEEGVEHVVGFGQIVSPGTPGFPIFNFWVRIPYGACPCTWVRARLDWGEDCGEVTKIDPTLAGPRGAAQFGEVEDYEIKLPDAPCEGWYLYQPNGGEAISSGSIYTIQWCARTDLVKFKLLYSLNNGITWRKIATNVTGRIYDWTVPAPWNNKRQCLVKVIGYNAIGEKLYVDTSDATFTIEVIKVTSPNGGEVLKSGNTHTLTWITNATKNPVAEVMLSYTDNGGATWNPIITLTANSGSYNWVLPPVSVIKPRCKVKVVLKDSSGITVGSDKSDTFFTIGP